MQNTQIISDLHLHSRFSRACSKDLTIKNLEKWGRIKGLDLLGTGDFTHPKWIVELKESLNEDETGILKTDSKYNFLLSSEVSLMFSQGGKGRRIHNVILAPSFEIVEQITEYLKKKGRIDYDGRPIFNIPCPEFVYEMKKISNDIEVIPAHIWTPWFSLFGSKSGFNSIQDCFQDQTKNIFAVETGMSSDPAMNWRLSQLERFSILSFSDLHSFWPWRIGREATVFDLKEKDVTYKSIIKALRTKEGLHSTIEVDPSYGKYHFTGHRNCNIVLSPGESLKIHDVCPVCRRNLTVGVLERVEELADKPENYKPRDAIPFKTLVPLSEVISGVLKTTPFSTKTWEEYNKLLQNFKSEFNIMLNVSFEELKKVTSELIAELIMKNREGKIQVKPGFDGVYGVPLIYGNEDYDFNEKGDEEGKETKNEGTEKKETHKKGKQQQNLSEFF